MKQCKKCLKTKDFSSFGKHKLGANGLRPRCKDCTRIETKEYNKKPEKKVSTAKYRNKNRDKLKQSYRKYRTGLTDIQFKTLISVQENKCDICKTKFTDTPRVDHNH